MKPSLLILAILISSSLFGQKTILWKITDTINKHESYLLGTYHPIGNSFIDSISIINDLIVKSDLSIFETDIDTSGTCSCDTRNPSDLIYENLDKEDIEYISELYKKINVEITKLTPAELHRDLTRKYYRTVCGSVKKEDTWGHFDNYLKVIASKNSIKIIGLEKREESAKYFNKELEDFTWYKGRGNIHEIVSALKNAIVDTSFCQELWDYQKFNVFYNFDEPCIKNYLIVERNENWMRILPDLLLNKNCFIAVGFAHLQNQCGLIKQLQDLGFIVEPVVLKPVVPIDYIAVEHFTIGCKIKRFKKANITIKENGIVVDSLIRKRKISYIFKPNSQYTIEVGKNKYTTKVILVNTNLAYNSQPYSINHGFDFTVELIKNNSIENRKELVGEIFYSDDHNGLFFRRDNLIND